MYKKSFLLFLIALFFSCLNAGFILKVKKDPKLNETENVYVKVLINNIARTIGENNFQNITKQSFTTTILDNKADIEVYSQVEYNKSKINGQESFKGLVKDKTIVIGKNQNKITIKTN